MTQSLYRRLLGSRFDVLPAIVRELHDVQATTVWVGRADVERGRSWLSRAIATMFSLPPDGKGQPLRVTFEPVDGREIWTREYGTKIFRSVQQEHDGMLCEIVGPSRLLFELVTSAEGLALRTRGLRLFGVPLPRFMHPRVRSLDSEQDDRYRFEVEAYLPFAGLLVRYTGWLERAGAPSP